MTCNQNDPTNIENSSSQNTFYNNINEIIWALIVRPNGHQLQTSERCISARQRYECNILYAISDDFIDCI